MASFSLLFAVTLGRAEFNLDSQGIIVESVCVCVDGFASELHSGPRDDELQLGGGRGRRKT